MRTPPCWPAPFYVASPSACTALVAASAVPALTSTVTLRHAASIDMMMSLSSLAGNTDVPTGSCAAFCQMRTPCISPSAGQAPFHFARFAATSVGAPASRRFRSPS